jgi:hypothetical protein
MPYTSGFQIINLYLDIIYNIFVAIFPLMGIASLGIILLYLVRRVR